MNNDEDVSAPRGRKTWGPFTGRQLTLIICVVVAAVAFPVSAFAVTGNNVFVTDATSGKQSKVNSSGQLEVHPNGTKLQGNGSNNAIDASKAHQMLTIEATPASWFGNFKNIGYNGATPVVTPGAGQAAIVKTIHLASVAPNASPQAVILVQTLGNCAGTILYEDFVGFASSTNSALERHYDPGIVVPAGATLCVGSGSTNLYVTVDGYTVLPSAVS